MIFVVYGEKINQHRTQNNALLAVVDLKYSPKRGAARECKHESNSQLFYPIYVEHLHNDLEHMKLQL